MKKNPYEFHGNPSATACVGVNGGTNDIFIRDGYRSAVKSIENEIKEKKMEDILIYPLIFCARHSIELGLKIIFSLINTIYQIKNDENKCEISIAEIQEKSKMLHTHDIKILNELVSEFFLIDERISKKYFEFYSDLDVYYLDPEGDAFRYTTDTSNNPHMIDKKITHIDWQVFIEEYDNIIEEIENITIYILEIIIPEYDQKTFTKQLNREQIFEISQMIGDIDAAIWKTSKTELCEKFHISQKELSKAIDLIKLNREFSYNIGKELKFMDISEKSLKAYLRYVWEYDRIKIVKNKYQVEFPQKESEEIEKRFLDVISYEELVALIAFIEISKRSHYAESLDGVYKESFEVYHNSKEHAIYKLGSGRLHNHLINGLKVCGQGSYLKVLEEYKCS